MPYPAGGDATGGGTCVRPAPCPQQLLPSRQRPPAAQPGAFVSLTTALAANPDHVPCLLELAALYKAKGMLSEARGALERAVAATAPPAGAAGGAAAATGAALASAAAAAVPSAAGQAEEAARAAIPADARAPGAAAACSELDRDAARAREALATVLTDLGTAAKAAGRVADAVELYRAALDTAPKLAAAHYNLVAWGAGWLRGGAGAEGRLWQRVAVAVVHFPAITASAAGCW